MKHFENFIKKHNPRISLSSKANKRIYQKIFNRQKKRSFIISPRFFIGGGLAAAAVALITVSTFYFNQTRYEDAESAEYIPETFIQTPKLEDVVIDDIKGIEELNDADISSSNEISALSSSPQTVQADSIKPAPAEEPAFEIPAEPDIAKMDEFPPAPSPGIEPALETEIEALVDTLAAKTISSLELEEEVDSIAGVEEIKEDSVRAFGAERLSSTEDAISYDESEAIQDKQHTTLSEYITNPELIYKKILHTKIPATIAGIKIDTIDFNAAQYTKVSLNSKETIGLFYLIAEQDKKVSPTTDMEISDLDEYDYIILYLLAKKDAGINDYILKTLGKTHQYYEVFNQLSR